MEECKDGKIFIGGLSKMTSEETLREYFNKYGEVKECQILRDRVTRISRGFGFLTFVDPSHVHLLLQIPHTIDGSMVDVKTARPSCESSQDRNERINTTNHGNCQDEIAVKKKIFVGGLPTTLKNEDFKKYFEQFGKVEDGVVMYNTENQSRGFGFITFDSEEAVENVLQHQRVKFHELENKRVEVKRAKPKDILNRKMYANDAHNIIGLGFGIEPTFGGYGGYHPYACMPHHYYYYYYGVESYNGGGYGFYQSSYPNNPRIFHSAYMGAHMNDCDDGLVHSSFEALSLESVAKPTASADEEVMTALCDRNKSSSSVGDDHQSDSPTTSACLSNGSNNENGSPRKSCLCSFN